jgi:hypothetical protein
MLGLYLILSGGREIQMTSKAEEYVVKLEKFLGDLGVTGTYFCARQYERWRGRALRAFEEASSSTTVRNRSAKKAKSRRSAAKSDG